jgi:hypothetical protein
MEECVIENCQICADKADPCQSCGSHDVVVDDFGICLCQKCLDSDTTAQKALRSHYEKESFMFGYDDYSS